MALRSGILVILACAACTVPNDPVESVTYVDRIVEVPVEIPVIVEVPVEVPVYIYPEQEMELEAEPEPEPAVPAWTPEPGHVYVLSGDTVVRDYSTAETGMSYSELWTAVWYNVETHNADFPDDPWTMIGGGP